MRWTGVGEKRMRGADKEWMERSTEDNLNSSYDKENQERICTRYQEKQ